MKFVKEVKRHKVRNTASLYVVGIWILLQVLEVLQQLLPPGAMRWALIGAAALYPIVFLAGWFFDISKEGIIRTGPVTAADALPDPGFMDYVQLAGHALVIGFVAYALSTPPGAELTPMAAGPPDQQRTIAVLAFEDLEPAEGGTDIGETLAGELRSTLTRVAGLRVLGPETSKALSLAGENRNEMARELAITALLLGQVRLEAGRLHIATRLSGVPAGNELWSTTAEGPVEDGVALQNKLARQVIAAIAPTLDPNPVRGPRAEAGACTTVYERYLQAKRLASARIHSQRENHERGLEMLHQIVSDDAQCALAWEALAVASVDFSMPGWAQAAAAARRALELNDALPEAWMVLAEIAENEERWSDSEEYFLRALYADPTDAQANMRYSQALVARGRARKALRHALEAYRHEPASIPVNNTVSLAALYAGDTETVLKHSGIAVSLEGEPNAFLMDSIAEAHLLRGDTDQALEVYREGGLMPEWFPECVQVRDEPGLAPLVKSALLQTHEQIISGQRQVRWSNTWRLIRCGTWLGEPDIAFDVLLADGMDSPYFDKFPAAIVFTNLFIPDGTALRQDLRFRELVEKSGLLDYWRKWGWADLCRPDGDSFACD